MFLVVTRKWALILGFRPTEKVRVYNYMNKQVVVMWMDTVTYCVFLHCFRSVKNGWAWAVSFIPYWFRAWTERWQIIVLSTCVRYSFLWLVSAFKKIFLNSLQLMISWIPIKSGVYKIKQVILWCSEWILQLKCLKVSDCFYCVRRKKKATMPTGATKYFMNH